MIPEREASPAAATMTKDVALRISGLEAGYEGTTVLRDVSLTVPAGEVTALLGPNGAGKSTLLRAVSGFLPATKGSITLFGEDVTSMRRTAGLRPASAMCPRAAASSGR